jgi:hypothetical protein
LLRPHTWRGGPGLRFRSWVRTSVNFFLKIYLDGTRKRELVQKDVLFLGFESFLLRKKVKKIFKVLSRDVISLKKFVK